MDMRKKLHKDATKSFATGADSRDAFSSDSDLSLPGIHSGWAHFLVRITCYALFVI